MAEEPLRRARARHPELDLRLVSDAGPWELEDSSFDVVWAGEVLEHVADTAAWLSEVRRVLRSGGSLLLSTPAHERLTLLRVALSGRAFAERFEPRGDHLRFYSRDTLARLLGGLRLRADQRAGRRRPARRPPAAARARDSRALLSAAARRAAAARAALWRAAASSAWM